MSDTVILPGAPNFQKFLEGKGNLEARITEVPPNIDPRNYGSATYRRTHRAVILDGKETGTLVIVGRQEGILTLSYTGEIPGYSNGKTISLSACFEEVPLFSDYAPVLSHDKGPQRQDEHKEIPFP